MVQDDNDIPMAVLLGGGHEVYLLHSYVAGLKVGRMIRTMWVTWVTILMGQVGIIHKLNYLDVTRIF